MDKELIEKVARIIAQEHPNQLKYTLSPRELALKLIPIIEAETIKTLLDAIEEHGLDKVLALMKKKRKPFNWGIFSNPVEIRGRGTGV